MEKFGENRFFSTQHALGTFFKIPCLSKFLISKGFWNPWNFLPCLSTSEISDFFKKNWENHFSALYFKKRWFSPNFSTKIVPRHFKDKNFLRAWRFEQRWFSRNLFLSKLFQNISNLRFFSEQYLLDKKSFKNIVFWKTVMFSQFF